jgi:hypothetical protein
MATKDFVDYSPASGSNNGSIDITVPRNPQTTPRSTAIAIEGGGGLSKTIAVNQNAALLIIGDFGRNSTEYGLWTTIQVNAIGIKGIAYCTMSDSSVIEKELNNTVNVVESEHCMFVSLEGRRVNDASKVVTFNMQTTLDFIGHADTLCELFIDIDFNSAKKNTQLDVTPFYESLVYEINDCLMTMYPDNHMLINFNIVDFDEAAKERIRSIVTCDRFAVTF